MRDLPVEESEGSHYGLLKRPSNEAAGELKLEAYPLGYVEDFDELRTKLGAFSAAC